MSPRRGDIYCALAPPGGKAWFPATVGIVAQSKMRCIGFTWLQVASNREGIECRRERTLDSRVTPKNRRSNGDKN